MDSHVRFLRPLLQMHWLRPETALWRALDCMLMEPHTLAAPALDLGCGDGSLSYLMAGGRFIPSHDVYQFTSGLGQFSEGADIYDVIPTMRSEVIDRTTTPRYRFDVGLDHKVGLLSKAAQLDGFYGQLLQHDANVPLPFDEGSFRSVFSNILYWLVDVPDALREVHRILIDGGRFYTFVPDRLFKQMAWVYFRRDKPPGYDFLNFIDRGYEALIHHTHNLDTWSSMFAQAGFQVVHHQAYLARPVMDVWNVGTRPISHLLISMANRLDAEARQAEKAHWVDFFEAFFTPLLTGAGEPAPLDEHGFHFFVLERQAAPASP